MTLIDIPTRAPTAPPEIEEPDARAAGTENAPGRLVSLVRGAPDDPVWVRPALLSLLVGTTVLYTWTLSESQWANSFYTAAAQAGSVSWKAFFFGSSDAANSITVDKPSLFLWPQALAVRLFGLNPWSVLVPQALMGVGSVAVLYSAVRRWFTPAAGLIAGAVLALTPVAALMFRYNNPEALLTLLITVAAYTALRAIDDGRARWFVATGIAIGFGFLTKQLQVLLVVPGFALAYLTFGSPLLRRRIRDLALAALSMVLAAGWWIAIVELWPKSSRPYIGGSQNNSIIELTLGYNGLGRLTGQETGSVGAGGPRGGNLWGETGITRLFDNEMGGQIAWLLPTAIACLIIGLWLTRHAPRHSLQRSSLVVWGGWLVVTALTFSYMSGIFHAYYNVVLAPAIGALVGIGTTLLWARREHWAAATALAGLSVATACRATQLLERAPSWHPWLAHAVLVAGIAAGIGFMISALPRRVIPARLLTSVAVLAGILGATAALAAPTGWTLETVSTGHQGSLVTAGPAVANGGPVGGFGERGNGPGGGFPAVPNNGALPAGRFPGGPGNGGPVGGFPGLPGNGTPPTGRFPGGTGGTGPPAGGFPGRTGIGGAPGGGLGGLLNGVTVTDTVASLLIDDASSFTWVAAVAGSQNASSYQLATEEPVMPIGGFNGSDPSPTLADFQSYVTDRKIHYYIATGLSDVRSMNGSDTARQIEEWVSANYKPITVGGTTLYDLTT